MPDLFDYEILDPAQERWWELYRPTDAVCSVCGYPATAIFAGYGVEWRGIAACSPSHEARAITTTRETIMPGEAKLSLGENGEIVLIAEPDGSVVLCITEDDENYPTIAEVTISEYRAGTVAAWFKQWAEERGVAL